jgi:type III restriction enzyme
VRFKLKNYQVDAVTEVLKNLDRARQDYHERKDLVAFSLSATTGAGKTVMATAVLEALFGGSGDFDVDPDPSAVVLWVTDDPSLNEQTRYRLIESGDQLDAGRLRVIANGFDQERLDPSYIYFLNIQKLASGTSWVKQSDKRNFTLWETIQNTIEDESTTLYLVLDEAHRGMRPRSSSEESLRSTIVQRLINGDGGVPPVPIVWGISATVQRFADAMQAAQAEGRITYPAVSVDPKTVQESGLLKDTIILDFPDEKGAFETTLLRTAVRSLKESTELWNGYAEHEDLSTPVVPLMVFQVPNRPKEKSVAAMLDVIFEEWPELEPTSVANVFGEHSDLAFGSYVAPYIAPQDVEGAHNVRILLAKDAISTGWDCPRAEVLFSLRPAKDRTHITQLLGRMVRTPLARRVETDERLNAVTCFLPRFDFGKATEVAKLLTGEKPEADGPGFGRGTGRKALTSPITMTWNQGIPSDIADVFRSLPSETVPKAQPKPIRRLLALAAEIAVDGLKPKPNEDALDALFAALDGQLAQHRSEVDALVEDFYIAEIRRITSSVYGSDRRDDTYQEKADQRTIDEVFRRSVRALGAAVANGYTKRLALAEASSKDDDLDIYKSKAILAALVSVEGTVETIEVDAEQLANAWLNSLRTKIKSLGEDRKIVYDDIKREARDPQRIDPVVPESRIENTRDANDNLLPTRPLHLVADEQGAFPVGALNDWELSVIDTELDRGEVVGWYRNPSAATANAIQAPYRIGTRWKPLQPDFILFSRKKDGSIVPSIVDPHGAHLADAMPKLKGLAAFAERYANEFLRIEAVAIVNAKGLRLLDLTDPDVRSAVETAQNAADLYAGDFAQPYE